MSFHGRLWGVNPIKLLFRCLTCLLPDIYVHILDNKMYGTHLSLLIYNLYLDTTSNSPKEGAISYNKGHVCCRIYEYVSLQL